MLYPLILTGYLRYLIVLCGINCMQLNALYNHKVSWFFWSYDASLADNVFNFLNWQSFHLVRFNNKICRLLTTCAGVGGGKLAVVTIILFSSGVLGCVFFKLQWMTDTWALPRFFCKYLKIKTQNIKKINVFNDVYITFLVFKVEQDTRNDVVFDVKTSVLGRWQWMVAIGNNLFI